MLQTIHKSIASITYIQGAHFQDLWVVIADPAVFNVLPGKPERQGIKTLATWPIFVTAALCENPSPITTLPAEIAH